MEKIRAYILDLAQEIHTVTFWQTHARAHTHTHSHKTSKGQSRSEIKIGRATRRGKDEGKGWQTLSLQ